MLPPGHIAAGYLVGSALLKFANPALDQHQQFSILGWSMFWAFAPDLDVFYYFLKNRTMLIAGNTPANHRRYLTHVPVLWLVAGLLVCFLAPSLKYFSLSLILGSFSHFFLDSIDYGIMWLWPFSSKVYALKNREVKFTIEEKSFLPHIWHFLKLYSKTLTFFCEILILLLAVIVYLN